MAKRREPVELMYLATRRHVVALDAASGEEVWRTKLPHGDSIGAMSLLVRGDRVFVGGCGHVHCLRAATGEVVWSNDLPKLGYQTVILAMRGAGDSVATVLASAAAAQAAAAAAS